MNICVGVCFCFFEWIGYPLVHLGESKRNTVPDIFVDVGGTTLWGVIVDISSFLPREGSPL